MTALPPAFFPAAPFPLVVAQSKAASAVAPGVELDTYHFATSRGPLVIRAIVVDLSEPTIRIRSVLANDALRSAGETVSAMARRTGAVAGINADYFDIGQTNQPLNLVVRDGMLLRSPSGRATLTVTPAGGLRFGTYRFTGNVTSGDRTWTLEGVDEWPPQGSGAMLLLPAFGPAFPPSALAPTRLEPQGPLALPPGSADYRVAEAQQRCPSCVTLAFGARAAEVGALPSPGESVHVEATLDPPIAPGSTAVGGGPLLVKDGQPYADPDPPSPAEALQHDPQAGAMRAADGSLVLIAVDGRDHERSVGLTRPEMTALLLAMHATDAMAFDSGGSATLVARVPGDSVASLRNVPSDGHERAVADGLFIYNGMPLGPATHLAVRPESLVLLRGAEVQVRTVPLDASGHPVDATSGPVAVRIEPASLGRVEPGGVVVADQPGSGLLTVRQGALAATVPLRVERSVAALRIDPRDPNPTAGGSVAFRADGSDRSGAPIALGDRVTWSASSGAIDSAGRYRAGSSDATVTANAAGRQTQVTVRVGRSEGSLGVFEPRSTWRFETVPRSGVGSATLDFSDMRSGVLLLQYDLDRERAAYATTAVDLSGRPLALSVDVRGDGSGAGLRAAFDNADGDRIAVTLARRIDWQGWRRCEATLPPTAAPPLRLRALYVVASLGGPPARGTGTIALRAMRATFAGSSAGTIKE